MSERDLRLQVRQVLRDPEDPGAWGVAMQLAARLGLGLPEDLRPLATPARTRSLLQARPQVRALDRLVPAAFGLEPTRAPLRTLGRFWVEAGRLGLEGDAPYDRATGLPLVVRRPGDAAEMRLVPAMRVRLRVPRGPSVHADVPAFYLDRFPLDRGRFASYLVRGEAGHGVRDVFGQDADFGELREAFRRSPSQRAREPWKLPVASVSGPLARDYAAWVAARFPTHRELDHAAYGAELSPLPWGEDLVDATRANYDPYLPSRRYPRQPRAPQRLGEYLRPVGSYGAGRGPYGHEELVGSMAEWVEGLCVGRLEVHGTSCLSRLDELHSGCWRPPRRPAGGNLWDDRVLRVAGPPLPLGLRLACSIDA